MLNLFQHIFLLASCLTAVSQSSTQTGTGAKDQKEIEIINTDFLKYYNVGYNVQYLVGHVKLKHENTYLECDSALVFRDSKRIDAYGRVYINHNGSVDIYCDTGYYFGASRTAELHGHVSLNDGKMKLLAPEVKYNMNTSIGYYTHDGVVYSDESIIKSKQGTYYNQSSDVLFRDSVIVTNPKFVLTSDTLAYNTQTDRATFYSYTTIKGDGSTIKCYTGHYDTKRGIADFGPNTVILNGSQTLYSDSIYYDRNLQYAKTFRHYVMIDDSNQIAIIGTRANYKEENKYLFAFERPLFINYSEADTLFLKADTIISFAKDSSDKRFFSGFRNVRIFKNDLQAKADSLYYSFEDSTFKLFYAPIIWSDQMQSSADTIFISTIANKPSKIYYYKNGFIVMQTTKNYYDQIKGNKITAYLKNNAIESMDVKGNAESIYYGKNDEDKLLGQNNAKCSSMKLYFNDKKVDIVKFIGKPVAVFTPVKQLKEDQKYLKNFNWQDKIRPKGKFDL